MPKKPMPKKPMPKKKSRARRPAKKLLRSKDSAPTRQISWTPQPGEQPSIRKILTVLVMSGYEILMRRGKPEKGRHYINLMDFVLDQGTEFSSAPLTDDEHNLVVQAADRYGRPFNQMRCYHNAFVMALNDPNHSLRYCEGYFTTGSFPFHHAWVTLNGKVVDVTCRKNNGSRGKRLGRNVLGEIPEGWGYMGVAIDLEQAKQRLKIAKGWCDPYFDEDVLSEELLAKLRRHPVPTSVDGVIDELRRLGAVVREDG